MTRDDVIRMARQAGFTIGPHCSRTSGDNALIDMLMHLAKMVAAAEREACCGCEVVNSARILGSDYPHIVVEKYQRAIRARGERDDV